MHEILAVRDRTSTPIPQFEFPPPPVRPRRGTRRRPPATPWPLLVSFGLALGGGVAGFEAFSLAGWSEVQMIGFLSGYGVLSGLLLSIRGVLAKMQDQQARMFDALRERPAPASPAKAGGRWAA